MRSANRKTSNRKTSIVAILVILLLAFAVLLTRTCRSPRLHAASSSPALRSFRN
jgi:hypothetical protein